MLFTAPFTPATWHNFAVRVDWANRTLAVLFSTDAAPLRVVAKPAPNLSTAAGAAGQGDFHFGVLKVRSLIVLSREKELMRGYLDVRSSRW